MAPRSRIHATATDVSSPPENAMPTRSPTGSDMSTSALEAEVEASGIADDAIRRRLAECRLTARTADGWGHGTGVPDTDRSTTPRRRDRRRRRSPLRRGRGRPNARKSGTAITPSTTAPPRLISDDMAEPEARDRTECGRDDERNQPDHDRLRIRPRSEPPRADSHLLAGLPHRHVSQERAGPRHHQYDPPRHHEFTDPRDPRRPRLLRNPVDRAGPLSRRPMARGEGPSFAAGWAPDTGAGGRSLEGAAGRPTRPRHYGVEAPRGVACGSRRYRAAQCHTTSRSERPSRSSRSSSRCGTRRSTSTRARRAVGGRCERLVASGEIARLRADRRRRRVHRPHAGDRRPARRRRPAGPGRPPPTQPQARRRDEDRIRQRHRRPGALHRRRPAVRHGRAAQGGPHHAHLRGRHRQRLPLRPHRRGLARGRSTRTSTTS